MQKNIEEKKGAFNNVTLEKLWIENTGVGKDTMKKYLGQALRCDSIIISALHNNFHASKLNHMINNEIGCVLAVCLLRLHIWWIRLHPLLEFFCTSSCSLVRYR